MRAFAFILCLLLMFAAPTAATAQSTDTTTPVATSAPAADADDAGVDDDGDEDEISPVTTLIAAGVCGLIVLTGLAIRRRRAQVAEADGE